MKVRDLARQIREATLYRDMLSNGTRLLVVDDADQREMSVQSVSFVSERGALVVLVRKEE